MVEILGHEIPSSRLALVAGGGILLLLWLRSRSMQQQAPLAPASGGVDPEYLGIVAQAQNELQKLQAGSALDSKRIDLKTHSLDLQNEQFQSVNPFSQRMCVSWERWYHLSAADRKQILSQVRNGKALVQPTITGMCVTPTQIGARGSEPYASVSYDSGGGIFGGGSTARARGPAGQVPYVSPPTPQPDPFTSFLAAALAAYTQGGY